MDREFQIVGLIAAAWVLLALTFLQMQLWWDEAVYIGMGKWIFSFGSIGLWESFRPPFLPLLLGSIWKLQLDPILSGKFLGILFGAGTILFTFLICRKIFSRSVALISALFVAITPFFLFSSRILTTIPSLFFCLSAIYFAINDTRKSLFAAGIFAAIAFLTRFVAALIGVGIFGILLARRTFKKSSLFLSGIIITLAPWLLANFLYYGSAISPLYAQWKVASQTAWAYQSSLIFYPAKLLDQNPLLFLSIIGLAFIAFEKKIEYPQLLILIPFLLTAFFLSLFPNKQLRFLNSAISFLAIYSSYGIKKLFNLFRSKIQLDKRFSPLLFVLVLIPFLLAFNLPRFSEMFPSGRKSNLTKFYETLGSKEGKILLSTSTLPAAYTNAKIIVLPQNPSKAIKAFNKQKEKVDYFVVNSCNIGWLRKEKAVLAKKEEFLQLLKNELNEIKSVRWHLCKLALYE